MEFIKKTFLIILFLITFILISPNVLSAGVSYAHQTSYFFEPNAEYEFIFDAYSNTDKTMDHIVYLKGNLINYTTFSPEIFKNIKPGETMQVTAKLKLPSELPSGFNKIFVCIEETAPRGDVDPNASIGTKIAVCPSITIISLYDAPLIDFEIDAPHMAKDSIGAIGLDVQSLTKQDLDIYGKISIFEKSDINFENEITNLVTEHESLKSAELKTLKSYWDNSGQSIGQYVAVATVYYNGESLTKNKTFMIGDLSMTILNYTESIEKDGLQKIGVTAKNNWNNLISSVYATFNITKNNKSVAFVSTPIQNFGAWKNQTLETYLDTSNLSIETYDMEVILKFAGKEEKEIGLLDVYKKLKLSSTLILVISIGLFLLLVIIALIILWLKERKEREKYKQFVNQKDIKR